jgi:hypothetical protein
MKTQSATATVTHAVTVAAGVFGPGHLGELTQYLPFELVDEVLEQTKTVQWRLRRLPSRAGVYFILALSLFPHLGYVRVWGKLTAGLGAPTAPRPSEKTLRDLRRRLGPAPLKALFDVVAGPLAQPHTPGVRFAGLRTVAFDGNEFLAEVAATGAVPLARAKSTRSPLVLRHLPDGSYLSALGKLDVRIIEAEVAMTGAGGTRIADSYRLITTLLDHHRYPADALIRLYHERWEIESAYLALRHTLQDGQVLRSGDRPGVEQELWALLTVYQLLRMAMVTAVETRPGTNPDRASFTSALEAARDQLTAAAGICPDGPADLPGVIGRAVLATLLPARRPRFSARKVKCATSRYLNHGDERPHAVTVITAIRVSISTPPINTSVSKRRPHRRTSPLLGPPRPTRRGMITGIITSQPPRDWSGHELAILLGVKPRNMLTQLGEWARLGFFTRTGFGTYRLSTPPADESSTTGPDP